MALIYETEHFLLESHESPEVDRREGWHIKITPKKMLVDRTCLSPREAIELMRSTIVAGRAMIAWMEKRWVHIGRINYQDNWNWKPELHIHLYGRAIDATIQRYWDPIKPGHRNEFEPLDEYDIGEIKNMCTVLFKLEEFSDKDWWLS